MAGASARVVPVTPERWDDLAALFATSAVMRGCWCIWPRVPRERMRVGPENEARLRASVDGGEVPGLLAYADGVPVGWCSVGPRMHYRRFFDADADADVWLIACLFVGAGWRGRRAGEALVEAAVDYAVEHGARRIEALPRGWRPDDDPDMMDAVFRLFRRAGFTERAAGGVARMGREVERRA